MTKPKPPEMEIISPETHAKLKAIKTRIDELNAQIKELEEEAYWLVPKHTFDECKAMECVHTYRNRWDCHHYCVRRLHETGHFHDYYEKKKPVIKPHVEYPTLGWKKAIPFRCSPRNGWCGFEVVRETEKALFLARGYDKMLLKSTIFTIEDVSYIKDRSGDIHLCADNPETVDMQKALLEMQYEE